MKSKLEIMIGEGVRSRDVTVSGVDIRNGCWFDQHMGVTYTQSATRSLSDEECAAIDSWVAKNKLGKRISYSTWRMNNDANVTAFMLRWS
jgi:hypothetical protein